MIIKDFTEPELQYFRDNCNFNGYEREIFEGRARGKTLDELAEQYHISRDWVGKISQKVNKKIIRVI